MVANDVAVAFCRISALILEQSEDRGIERAGRGLDHFLFCQHRAEAEAAGGVFERAGGEMVDVFGVEFLERSVEKIAVPGCVRSLQIQVASRGEEAPCSSEKGWDVVNMFKHMTKDNAVKLGHLRGRCSRRDGSNIGFKSALAAGCGTTRRRIDSGNRRKSLVAKSRKQAAGGAASVENRGGARWQGAGEVTGSYRETGRVVGGDSAARGGRCVVIF